jgi:hypothetical protein
MHSVALLKWWYSAGWADQLAGVFLKLQQAGDFFSIPLLLKTLFQPFRQIGTEQVRGALDVKVRAWVDRLMSRFIGAMVRLTMILLGIAWWLLWLLIGAMWLIIWPFLPVLPVVGLGLSLGAGL